MISTKPNTAGTNVPVPMVTPEQANRQSPIAQTDRLAQLVDRRREAAAIVAGLDVEIAIALGARDAANRAMQEMRAQVLARRAVREAGCFFDQSGERDAAAMQGRVG